MINKLNLAVAFVLFSLASLGAQTISYPVGCLPPEINNLPFDSPKVFANIEVDGAPAPVGDVVGVYNENGDLVGRGTTFNQESPSGDFTAVLIYLQTDDSGAPTCGFFTPGEEVTLVLENAPSLNLRATNSTFVGIPGSASGVLLGPDGIEAPQVDTFNFENRFLPVTFAALQARDLGGKVSIEWSTASESGNDYFVVEHGTSVGEFAEVGVVAGAGDSQELLTYDMVHDNPIVGTNYYRIKQVDFEGTFSYSGIVPVDVAGTPSAEVALFPNPASNYFNLNVGSDWKAEDVSVAVFNIAGRRMMEWTQSTSVTRQVFTDALPAGVYLLRVDGAQRTSTQRLVIE